MVPCPHTRYLLVADAETRPTGTEYAGVCEACGLILVVQTVGKSAVATTFRLSERLLKAAAKATKPKGGR